MSKHVAYEKGCESDRWKVAKMSYPEVTFNNNNAFIAVRPL